MLREIIDTKRPDDPYREVDPMTHKVVINGDQAYNGLSQQEIFVDRFGKKELQNKLGGNLFIKIPGFNEEQCSSDDDQCYKFTRSMYKPFQ